MKKLIGIVLVLIVSTSSSIAQDNYGYYGKKTFVDISSSSYIPLIYNLTTYQKGQELAPSGNSLISSDTWFNIGLRTSIGRALSSKVGIAFEFGFDRYRIYENVFGDPNDYYSYYYDESESVKVNSFLFMPRLEFSGPNGLLPNGIVHQVGIGLNLNKAVTRNYLRDFGSFTLGGPNADPDDAEQLMIDNKLDKSVKLMQIMYGLKMRTPVGKSMMFIYGFRYTLDFGVNNSGFGTASTLNDRFFRSVRRYQFRNVIAFDLGLTLPF